MENDVQRGLQGFIGVIYGDGQENQDYRTIQGFRA